ncbi:transglycosylase, partial [Methylobacterium trifolii]
MPVPKPSSISGIPAALLSILLLAGPVAHAAGPLRVGDAVLEPVAPEDLPGFPGADPAAALDAFRRV